MKIIDIIRKIFESITKLIELKSGSKTMLLIIAYSYETIILIILYTESTNIVFWKALNAVIGFLASSFHLFVIMLIKAIYDEYQGALKDEKRKVILKIIPCIFLYLALACLSYVSQFGMNLKLTNEENDQFIIVDRTADRKEKDIENLYILLDKTIREQSQMETTNAKYSTLEKKRIGYQSEISNLNIQKPVTNQNKKGDMFYYLAKQTGISRSALVGYQYTMSWFIVELCLLMTAGKLKRRKKVVDDKLEFKAYIKALFTYSERGRLQSDSWIAEKTGIPEKTCQQYRQKLANQNYSGRPLITIERGGATSTWKMENVLACVEAAYGAKEIKE